MPARDKLAGGLTVLGSLLISLAAPGARAAAVQPMPPTPAGDTNLISRGHYVATAADCQSCHTAAGGSPFAGGAPLKSAFGTLYGSNITSDVQTGIGGWTEAQFDRALRNGVGKDGAYLYPAMPYGSFTKMSPTDMHALWAYMRTVPAVKNTPPPNTLPFPLTIRSGVGVWQSLYFKPGEFAPQAGQSEVWNRGAYLVAALGHCDQCHTARNLAQGLETQHQLAGGTVEGWYAPDISGDPLSKVAGWTDHQLVQYLKSGIAPGNAKTFGPMAEVINDSLRYLTDADLEAIAVYLKDQPKGATSPKAEPVKFARVEAGRRVYEEHCSSCHRSDGKGSRKTVPALAGNDAVTAAEPYDVIMALLEGFPPQGTWGAMASFAGSLSDEEISDVANYVRTAWGNNAMPNATPWMVDDWHKNATPTNESHALLCPNLPVAQIRPALALGDQNLKAASTDHGEMSRLVRRYRAAMPGASAGVVIQALSTAYCRAIANDRISKMRMDTQIVDFAQRAAITVRGTAHGESSQ